VVGNPCLRGIAGPPFYAVLVHPGDVGTASGLLTNPDGRVLDGTGEPITGLYCCRSTWFLPLLASIGGVQARTHRSTLFRVPELLLGLAEM